MTMWRLRVLNSDGTDSGRMVGRLPSREEAEDYARRVFPGEVYILEHDPDQPPATKPSAPKLRYDLIPPEALDAMARVLGQAVESGKYPDRDWETKPRRWGEMFRAATGHAWAWWRGVERDPDSGFSHAEHALTRWAMIVAYEARKAGEDDRPRVKEAEAVEKGVVVPTVLGVGPSIPGVGTVGIRPLPWPNIWQNTAAG